MKAKVLLTLALALNLCLQAQQKPVRWEFRAVQVDSNAYHVIMKARIDIAWKLHSQFQDFDPINLATKVVFVKSPKYTLIDSVEELGQVQIEKGPFGNNQRYYTDEVMFLQVIELKDLNLPAVIGAITYRPVSGLKISSPITTTFCIPLSQ